MNSLKFEAILRRSLLVVALLVAMVGLAHLLHVHGLEPARNHVETLGVWAPIVILLLRGFSILFPALPSTAYSLLAGALLGFQLGFLTIIVADLIFCQLAFLLSRRFGREPINTFIGKPAMKRIDKFSVNQLDRNPMLLTGLLMTGLFDFVSYAAGLGQTSWRIFSLCLFVSVVISDAPVVAFAAGMFSGGPKLLVFSIIGVFTLAIVAGYVRRASHQKNSLP